MEATATKTNLLAPLAATPDNGADCDRVNIVLDQLLEGRRLTEEEEDYLIDHADDCSPCFDDIKKQQVFVGFLNQKVGRRPAPSALPQTIMARLQAEMA
ncbi:hypothetical protein GO988_10020 [Hymenobacter sp. HMF4947]|uniref:Zinc-finger domain-containing protein n=1 Tax=Hymenobacter ginkgonis TaxID=2682976 RepID=A0A7K1TE31_9BACT|nr:hypothetical protein [Hymenobacter ginkgonis]MVN76659.1 hypothetical protein [Hymenobacter ginkgonis]